MDNKRDTTGQSSSTMETKTTATQGERKGLGGHGRTRRGRRGGGHGGHGRSSQSASAPIAVEIEPPVRPETKASAVLSRALEGMVVFKAKNILYYYVNVMSVVERSTELQQLTTSMPRRQGQWRQQGEYQADYIRAVRIKLERVALHAGEIPLPLGMLTPGSFRIHRVYRTLADQYGDVVLRDGTIVRPCVTSGLLQLLVTIERNMRSAGHPDHGASLNPGNYRGWMRMAYGQLAYFNFFFVKLAHQLGMKFSTCRTMDEVAEQSVTILSNYMRRAGVPLNAADRNHWVGLPGHPRLADPLIFINDVWPGAANGMNAAFLAEYAAALNTYKSGVNPIAAGLGVFNAMFTLPNRWLHSNDYQFLKTRFPCDLVSTTPSGSLAPLVTVTNSELNAEASSYFAETTQFEYLLGILLENDTIMLHRDEISMITGVYELPGFQLHRCAPIGHSRNELLFSLLHEMTTAKFV